MQPSDETTPKLPPRQRHTVQAYLRSPRKSWEQRDGNLGRRKIRDQCPRQLHEDREAKDEGLVALLALGHWLSFGQRSDYCGHVHFAFDDLLVLPSVEQDVLQRDFTGRRVSARRPPPQLLADSRGRRDRRS